MVAFFVKNLYDCYILRFAAIKMPVSSVKAQMEYLMSDLSSERGGTSDDIFQNIIPMRS